MIRRAVAVAVVALLLGGGVAACGSTHGGVASNDAPPPSTDPGSATAPSSSTTSTTAGGPAPVGRSERPVPEGARSTSVVAPSEPVSVEIPTLGVRSSLQALGLDPGGAVAAPTEWGTAGWFAPGVQPGQPGPAVIAGHVDSLDGPAVFYRLGELEPGDEVLVGRADGSTLRFVVTGSGTFDKERFPSDLVYGPATEPALRLVTCGGLFDRSTGHYRSNVVVFAALDQ